MHDKLEKVLAFHCGPALAGIKSANLVSCLKSDYLDFFTLIKQYNQCFNKKGIYFEMMYSCQRHFLLMVYRKSRLEDWMSQKAQQELLIQAGYPETSDLNALLEYLKVRLASCCEFPHEVGAFLGYPPEDVIGFQKHKGKGHVLNGYWKVYGDAQKAKRLFDRYDKCRTALCRRVENGMSIVQLFAA
jgi:hypothetical protein